MSKRVAEESPGSSGPAKKVKQKSIQFVAKENLNFTLFHSQVSTTYLPHTIGPVSNSTELDINVLKFQNKKLANVSFLVGRILRSSFSYCSKLYLLCKSAH